jgi:hypothetical protein
VKIIVLIKVILKIMDFSIAIKNANLMRKRHGELIHRTEKLKLIGNATLIVDWENLNQKVFAE